MITPVVRVSTSYSYGGNNEGPFSEVYLSPIALYQFRGEDHREKADAMANELNSVIQKYKALEEA